MATYNKFNAFVADIANKKHNFSSDQITVALTNTLPTSSNAVLADLTQISYTNLSSRNITTTSSTQISGTYSFILNNLTLTATGNVATFRYIVIYNSTASGGPLIAWYDYGSSLTMVNTNQLILNFDAVNGLLQIV